MNLLPGEEILYSSKPAPKVSILWLFTRGAPLALVSTGAAFVVLIFLNAFLHIIDFEKEGPATLYICVGIFFCLVVAILMKYMTALAGTFVYTITNQRFLSSGGIFLKVLHAVEIDRVTDVQLSQNVLEQFLSLHSINLFTPGTASAKPFSGRQPMPELRIEGVEDGEAMFTLVSRCVLEAKRGAA